MAVGVGLGHRLVEADSQRVRQMHLAERLCLYDIDAALNDFAEDDLLTIRSYVSRSRP